MDHQLFDLDERGLVDSIAGNTASRTPLRDAALAEMQRRQIEATREFNEQSGRQARTMINLTWAIVGLTVVLAILTAAMAWKG